jgi:hypothetical protein
MWILTERVFEYDDERYTSDGGYNTQKLFKSKEEATKVADEHNLDFVRGLQMSAYYDYEWEDFKEEFFKLWDENAPAIAVHCEIELPGRLGNSYEYDDAFHKLMDILPDEKVLDFANRNLKYLCWGVQEVEVVE